jgi:hypothetical protein
MGQRSMRNINEQLMDSKLSVRLVNVTWSTDVRFKSVTRGVC